MGFFSLTQEIAIDLGTANTIIISDDKVVVDEPSYVALDRRTEKLIEKEIPNIKSDKVKEIAKERLEKIAKGERDFRF